MDDKCSECLCVCKQMRYPSVNNTYNTVYARANAIVSSLTFPIIELKNSGSVDNLFHKNAKYKFFCRRKVVFIPARKLFFCKL